MSDTTDPNETPPVLDIAALVAPIPGDAPTGADLRTDPDPNSTYRRLKAAREAARSSERAQSMDPEAPPADWSEVAGLSVEILSSSSKDLEVSAWLVEALLREQGFAGLRDGFRVARELCEAFWDGLHPAITPDGGVPDRVFAFTGLNGEDRDGTLIAPIRMLRFATGPSGEPFGLWHWESAVEASGKVSEEGPAPGAATPGLIEEAVRSGDGAFYRTFVADLAAARREFGKLGETFDRLCGSDSPPGQYIRGVLEKYDEAIRHLARGHLAADPAAGGADAGGAATAGGAGGGGVHKGPIQSREDAFRQLESVSDYFRRTEPHSPLSYSLEQCVRWGRMPLPDLLVELVPDEATRSALFRLTGIRPPSQNPPSS